MATYRITVSYNGRDFDGWQRLKDSRKTIQGILENAISDVLDCDIEVTASGRTDAGVHARAQVCSFSCTEAVDAARFTERVNSILPRTISVLDMEQVEDRFNARIHAVDKTYCYTIWNSNTNPGMYSDVAVAFGQKVQVEQLQSVLNMFLGTHDFNPFATRSSNKNTVRCITKVQALEEGDLLKVYITGDGFLHNMVRNIVGVAMGCVMGHIDRDQIAEALQDRNADIKGYKAPARGLCLWNVNYGQPK